MLRETLKPSPEVKGTNALRTPERKTACRTSLFIAIEIKCLIFFLLFISFSFASPWCASSSRNYFIIEYIIITCVYWMERKESHLIAQTILNVKCTFRGLRGVFIWNSPLTSFMWLFFNTLSAQSHNSSSIIRKGEREGNKINAVKA